MKAKRILVPDEIVHHVGKILNRPIMSRIGVQKKVVPKYFWDQNRTLDERIVPDEEIVIPDSISR